MIRVKPGFRSMQLWAAVFTATLLLVACGGGAEEVDEAGTPEGDVAETDAAGTDAAETDAAETDAAATDTAETDGGGETAAEGDLPVVRIHGLLGGTSEAAMRIIEMNEFDIKNGFDGEFLTVDADASVQFLLQRESDVSFDLDPVTAALLRTQGNNITTFYPLVTQDATMLVAGDAPYETPEDVMGETVGHDGLQSGTMTTAQIMLDVFRDIQLTEDYNLQLVQEAALIRLLNRGELDAIFLGQPEVLTAEINDGMKPIWGPAWQVWEEEVGGSTWNITMGAYDEWIEENPDLARAVTAAWDDAAAWITENSDRLTEDPFPELFGIDNPEVLQAFADLVGEGNYFVSRWTEEDAEAARNFIEFAAAEGTIIQEAPEGSVTRLE